jgi:RNA polymerase sigma factor (sigma-70 family)
VGDPDKQRFVATIEQAHGRQLRRFLASRLRGASADVPDLIQEIYLRLLRIKDHEAIRNPQAYLFTVAAHVIHQYRLRQSTKPELTNPLDVASEFHAATEYNSVADPAHDLDIEQRLERIGRDLTRISPRAYATLDMYRCEGMTLAEIGERLGVTHVTVRKYLSLAIAFCDEHLEELE